MPGNKYVINAQARTDLKVIAKYTAEKFREGQSLKYAEGLKSVLAEQCRNPELGHI